MKHLQKVKKITTFVNTEHIEIYQDSTNLNYCQIIMINISLFDDYQAPFNYCR